MTVKSILLCTALALAPATNPAGMNLAQQQASTTEDWCRGDNWGDREGVCEVREYTLPATGAAVRVDARPNGGISVEGAARADVLVHAKVVATAQTKERAKQIASAVQVTVAADKVSATGPDRQEGQEGWSVSYRLAVPERSSLSLQSTNGGISISHVDGHIDFTTVNGGVKLAAVAGEVKGRTSNGGVDVDLEGTTWQGEGLDVETHNGGVKLAVPDNYSAHLQTGTVNGGMHLDIPVTRQQGSGRVERNIDTQLGAGGPLIRVRTTNGGIRLTRK